MVPTRGWEAKVGGGERMLSVMAAEVVVVEAWAAVLGACSGLKR